MKPLNHYPKHKRKKLIYIRTKFHLRLGIYREYLLYPIPNEILLDSEAIQQFIVNCIDNGKKTLLIKWKLIFTADKISVSQFSKDFLQNTNSLVVQFRIIKAT